jgi:hypothetical protein
LIGTGHYNNNSAFDELLVRNTVDSHFYEWWIGSAQLVGVDLGAVSGVVAGAAAGDIAAANLIPLMDGAAPTDGGASPSAGSSPASSPTQAGLSPLSSDSTSLLVQSMASFGASGAQADSSGTLAATDPSQQPALATTIERQLAHA